MGSRFPRRLTGTHEKPLMKAICTMQQNSLPIVNNFITLNFLLGCVWQIKRRQNRRDKAGWEQGIWGFKEQDVLIYRGKPYKTTKDGFNSGYPQMSVPRRTKNKTNSSKKICNDWELFTFILKHLNPQNYILWFKKRHFSSQQHLSQPIVSLQNSHVFKVCAKTFYALGKDA